MGTTQNRPCRDGNSVMLVPWEGRDHSVPQ